MKTTALTLLAGLSASLVCWSAPLQKDHVSASARWVLHLDIEAGLKTKVGQYIADEIIADKLSNPLADLKDYYGVDLDWRKFQSFTLYGLDFEPPADQNGVLIVKSSQNIPAMLDAIITKVEDAGGKSPLRKAADGTYSLKNGAHGAARGGVFVLSKSSVKLDKALAVIDGKEPSLSKSSPFASLPQTPDSFVVLALADGFNSITALPPQARVLKNSTGGQVVLGEKSERVFASVALKTKDAESTAQIQQVVQGLIALAALNEDKNKDLAKLAAATKVSTNDNLVSVAIEWPAADVISKVKARHSKKGE